MPFLPVVERELRIASRKSGTYWMRIGAATGALLIGGWLLLMTHSMSAQQMGKVLFSALTWVLFIFAFVVGLKVTSDSLSEEKRDGTLGLLFLTDLRGYDIVFGKLVANSLGSFYGLLACFPVLAISILLGGVTYGEFWRVSLVALNILFLSLAAGMFASSVCRDERKAMSMSFLLVLLLTLGPLIGGVVYYYKSNIRPGDFHLLFSPGYAGALAFDLAYRGKSSLFWISSGITHAYGWIFLILACFIVPRSWQDKARSAREERAQQAMNDLALGKATSRTRFRTRLLDVNAFYWLASRNRLKVALVWGFLAVGAILWFYFKSKFRHDDWMNPGTYIVTALIVHTMLKYWVAGEACRRFLEDRRSGAMELLLSTPITVKDIIGGQMLALKRQFALPAICILVVDFILMVLGLSEFSRDQSVWILVWLAGMTVFVLDLYALSWLGMWQALVSQKVNRAAGNISTRIMFLPWLAFGITFAVVGIFALSPLFRTMMTFNIPGEMIVLYWFALSAGNALLWIRFARRRLNARFRDIATQRFEAPRPFWQFLKLPKPPVIR